MSFKDLAFCGDDYGDRSGFDNDKNDIAVYNVGDDNIDVNNKDSEFEITISD